MFVGYVLFVSVNDGVCYCCIVIFDLKFSIVYFFFIVKFFIFCLCVVDVLWRLGSSARGVWDLKSYNFFTVDWVDVIMCCFVLLYVFVCCEFDFIENFVFRYKLCEIIKVFECWGERERVECGAFAYRS